MNNDRRKAIKLLEVDIEALRALAEKARLAMEEYVGACDQAKNDIEAIRDEEQDYLDNIAENLKGGEKANDAEEAINNLEEAMSKLGEIVDSADGNSLFDDVVDDVLGYTSDARG